MGSLIGGWEVSLEAGLLPNGAAYDMAVYNDPGAGYDATGAPLYVPLDCQLLRVAADRGAAPASAGGAVAEAGRISADLHDPLGVLDPTHSPYGWQLVPGALLRVVARKDGLTRVVWTGTADDWDLDLLTMSGGLSGTDLVARAAATPVVDLPRPIEPAGQRIAALLQVMPEPPDALIADGGRILAASVLSGDLWQCMASVVESDGRSWLWLDAEGVLRWQPRARTAAPGTLLTDCPGTEPWAGVYTALTVGTDETLMVNQVEAQRIYPQGEDAPPARIYADDASRLKHDPHLHSNTRLQLPTDAAVDLWAAEMLDLWAWPDPGPSSLTLTVDELLPDEWSHRTMDTILGLELGDTVRVRLTTRPPDRMWDAVVSSLRHEATPGRWVCTVGLALRTPAMPGGYDDPASRYGATTYSGQTTAREVVYA